MVETCNSITEDLTSCQNSERIHSASCGTVAHWREVFSKGATVKKFVDISGEKFGRLTVIEFCGRSENNSFIFRCRCDCGNVVVKRGAHLKAGFIKSCGCFRKEDSARKGMMSKKHGMCFTATYGSWSAMHFRCSNPNHIHFNRYGGIGITVCERWNSFENFLEDMGERPNGKTLDRIDGNGNYCPENCRWSTPKEQGRNTKANVIIEHQGQSKCISEWAEISGLKYSTLKERLKRGWGIEKALQPVSVKGGLN